MDTTHRCNRHHTHSLYTLHHHHLALPHMDVLPHTPMGRGFHDNDTSLAIQPPRVPELTPKGLLGLSDEAEGSQEIEIGRWLSLRKRNWKPGC